MDAVDVTGARIALCRPAGHCIQTVVMEFVVHFSRISLVLSLASLES